MRSPRARRRSLRLPMSADHRNDRPTFFLALAGFVLPFVLPGLGGGALAQTSTKLASSPNPACAACRWAMGVPRRSCASTMTRMAAGMVASSPRAWLYAPVPPPRWRSVMPATRAAGRPAGAGMRVSSAWSSCATSATADLEACAGIGADRASARLSLSPSYYDAGRSACLELNGFRPLDERWRLTGQAGLLHWLCGYGAAVRTRIGLRRPGDRHRNRHRRRQHRSRRAGAPARSRTGRRACWALFAGASLGFRARPAFPHPLEPRRVARV